VLTPSGASREASIDEAAKLVQQICRISGPFSLVADARADLERSGMIEAVANHRTPALFNWLVTSFSYQGISDLVARQYIRSHGNITWHKIQRDISSRPACEKLTGYWRFYNCRYQKDAVTCAEPKGLLQCPLPRHDLRNGRLNQLAYSLFFFIRDIAEGDFVDWIDCRLAETAAASSVLDGRKFQDALLDPLRHVYGVSDKVLTMTLSSLLVGAGDKKQRWFEVGTQLVAVDSLVHNFLHRTGILKRTASSHQYGTRCYAANGCADILAEIAARIDAREFNRAFPAVFPRFIQLAIWRYCARDEFGICNGDHIDDRFRCQNHTCSVFAKCDRIKLKQTAVQLNILRN
jgi:hypothetical protein